jgi:hypothetical protein
MSSADFFQPSLTKAEHPLGDRAPVNCIVICARDDQRSDRVGDNELFMQESKLLLGIVLRRAKESGRKCEQRNRRDLRGGNTHVDEAHKGTGGARDTKHRYDQMFTSRRDRAACSIKIPAQVSHEDDVWRAGGIVESPLDCSCLALSRWTGDEDQSARCVQSRKEIAVQCGANRGCVTRAGVALLIRSVPDEPKLCRKKHNADVAVPLLVELVEKQAQQPFVASLPVLQQVGEVVDGIHQACQAVTLLGSKSATMTTVANEPRVNRCLFQYFETRR